MARNSASAGPTATLFPVAPRAELNIDHGRELGLGRGGGLANLLHLQRIHSEFTRGLTLTTADLVYLLEAFQRVVKERVPRD